MVASSWYHGAGPLVGVAIVGPRVHHLNQNNDVRMAKGDFKAKAKNNAGGGEGFVLCLENRRWEFRTIQIGLGF